jgi:autotransporter translocation and assembly factor TamB
MEPSGDRSRRRDERHALELGVLAAVLLLAVIALWLYVTYKPKTSTFESDSTNNAGTPTKSTTPARTALTKVQGEITAFEHAVSNQLTAEPVSTKPMRYPARVRIYNVVWKDPRDGSKFLNAESVTAQLDMAAAARGDFVVSSVVVSKPDMFVTSSNGQWNYERAMAPLLEPPPPGAPVTRKRLAIIRDIQIENGAGRVKPPSTDVSFFNVNARITRVVFSAPGLPEPQMDVATASGAMLRPGDKNRIALTLDNGHFRFPNNITGFQVAYATVDGTGVLDINGIWDSNLPGYGVRATGRIPNVRLADARNLFPSLPGEGNASFAWQIDPLPDGGTRVGLRDLSARTGGSRVLGALVADFSADTAAAPRLESADLRLDPLELALVEKLSGKKLPYAGSISGRVTGEKGDIHFDVNAHLTTALATTPFNVALVGDAAFAESGGFSLRKVTADLKGVPLSALQAFAPSLALKGAVTGRVTLNGPPGKSPLALDVRLNLANGLVSMAGTVNLTGATPAYDITGRLVGVHLDQLLAASVPPVTLNARYTLNGSGTDPALMNARFGVFGRFTGWQTTPEDTLVMNGSIGGGTLALDTASIRLATLTLNAGGHWHYQAPATGGLTYAFNLTSLAPFAPYLPGAAADSATGSVASAGSVSGSLDHPRLAGNLELARVNAAGYGVQSAKGTFGFALLPGLPDVDVDIAANNIRTPSAGNFQNATLRAHMVAPAISVNLHADREGGGLIDLVADGRIDPNGAREATLRTFALDLGQGRWSLVQPAIIAWGYPPGITVQNFQMQEEKGVGRFTLGGRLLPLENVDLHIDAVALPVDQLTRVTGANAQVVGRMSLNGTVRGPGSAPVINLRMSIDTGSVRGITFRSMQSDIAFSNQRLTATARASLTTGGGLDMRANIPMSLTLTGSPKFALLNTGALDGSLTADGVPLGALATLSPEVQDVKGTFNAHVTLSGTGDTPVLGGNAQLLAGSMRVPVLSQVFDSINGSVTLENRRVTIQTLRARAGGFASATGYVEFKDINDPRANIDVQLAGFQPMGAPGRRAAEASGNAHIEGPLNGAVLTGRVTLNNGDVAIPALGRPDLLATAMDDVTSTSLPNDFAPQGPSMFKSLTIYEFVIVAGDALWFSAEQARVQLSGELMVNKHGDDMRLVGTLEGDRGTFTLMAGPIVRTFAITHAQVRFLGDPELNPVIDVTAVKTVIDPTGRELDVLAHLGGTLNSPTLALNSPSGGVNLPESELLSVLIFGSPSVGLNGNLFAGSSVLGETFFGGLAEFSSVFLGSSIGNQLGLDVFQIRPGAGTYGGLAGASIVAGRQLSRNIFLTVEYGVGVLFGNAASSNPVSVRLDWRISRQWTARLAYEPVNRNRLFQGFGAGLPGGATAAPRQQWSVELRRRWTY